MKQFLLDAFQEKYLKLSENDPYVYVLNHAFFVYFKFWKDKYMYTILSSHLTLAGYLFLESVFSKPWNRI
jgi:hypothetical protein